MDGSLGNGRSKGHILYPLSHQRRRLRARPRAREGLLEHVREVAPYFRERLDTLRELDIIGDIRGSHLMQCVEFVKNKETKEIFPDVFDIGKRVSLHADQPGLIVRPLINQNIMSPVLTITREQMDFVASALREAIIRTQGDLRAGGQL